MKLTVVETKKRATWEPIVPELTIYTDGACSKGNGGWAWVAVADEQELARDAGGMLNTTNNVMEIEAAIGGLIWAPDDRPIQVVSDSAYVVNCFVDGWHYGWRKRGWVTSKGEPVANRAHWEWLLEIVRGRGAPILWTHIRGHGRGKNDDPIHVYWNDVVDKLAVAERKALVA